MESKDWSFVPQDIGAALLGWLIAGVGSTVWAAGAEWGAVPTLIGGLWAFVALWHLGWRLAFPDGFTLRGVTTGGLMIAAPIVLLAGIAYFFTVID